MRSYYCKQFCLNTYATTRALFFTRIQSELADHQEILAAQNKLEQLLDEHENQAQ
jgi:hypothetical protein